MRLHSWTRRTRSAKRLDNSPVDRTIPCPSKTDKLIALLKGQPVIPVLKIDDASDAVPLARALARGGLPVIEITMRTPHALEAIRRAAAEVPEAVVGAGTILTAAQFERPPRPARNSSSARAPPGEVFAAARGSAVPLLPGAITPSEMMAALEEGLDFLKFFPAEQAGGAAFLKSLASPFAGLRFCPTGGVTTKNAARLSVAAQRDLRRRFLGGARRCREGRQLGADREAGARSGRPRLKLTCVSEERHGAGSPAPHRCDQLVLKRATVMKVTALPVKRLASATCGALLEAGRIDFVRRRTHQVMRKRRHLGALRVAGKT